MGDGNITNAPANGETITNEFLQGPVSALKGDIVPRNSSGVAAAGAGSLGTDVFPFGAVHADLLFLKGKEANLGDGGGGGGSVAAGSTIQNGVVSWIAPAGRPGMCGAIHQNGSGGVTIEATTADPLVVKLDGVSYSRSSPIAGGTLPSDYSQAITPVVANYGVSDSGGGSWVSPEFRYLPMNADRAKYRYATGGEFAFDSITGSETLPDSYGNNIIIKSTGGASGTTYTYCQRVSNSASPSGRRNIAKLKMGAVFNTSADAQSYPAWQLPFHTAHKVIRCGGLFVDPLTATWNPAISPRIVGAVNTELPGVSGYATGDVVFLESNQRWYRFDGSAWARTSFVFLAFLAIDSGAVEGVLPVRSEESLSAMFDKKLAVLGDPVSREGVVDGDLIRFGGQRSDVEEKGFTELGGQGFNQQGTSAVVDTGDDDAGTLVNDEMFCCYLDVADNKYYFEPTPPIQQIYRQRLLLVHPNLQRLYVGSFVTDSSGNLIAAQSISNRGNRLDENNDDSFRIANPCLFGRSRLTDLGQPEDRRMQVSLRGRGTRSTGTNTYRYRWRGSRSFWAGYHLNKERWDELFFSYLTPHVTEQVEFDTDNIPDLVVEFSQWDEASLLYATGLTEAAREGRATGSGGAGGATDVGGSIGSVDGIQIVENSIGNRSLGPRAVQIYNIDTINEAANDLVLSVAQDPDDSNVLLLEWVANQGGGGGGTGFPVGGTKAAGKFVQATGTGANDQSWADIDYNDLSSLAATEADVFDDPTSNTKFTPNKLIGDAFKERDAQLDILWSDWSTPTTTTFASIAQSAGLQIGQGYSVEQRNSSSFNAQTSPLTAGTLYLVGTSVASGSLPSLSSGQLRGGLLWIDSENRRVFQPIDNPEGPDSEEYFELVSGSWQARAWNADFLYSHAHGLPDDDDWNGTASHLIGGPTANAFNDEAAVGRRSDKEIAIVRAGYSTSSNQFVIDISVSQVEIDTSHIKDGAITAAKLGADSVGLPAINATGQGANKVLAINAANNALVWATQTGGGTPGDGTITLPKLAAGSGTTAGQVLLATSATTMDFVDPENPGNFSSVAWGSITSPAKVSSLAGNNTFIFNQGSNPAITAYVSNTFNASTQDLSSATPTHILVMPNFGASNQSQVKVAGSTFYGGMFGRSGGSNYVYVSRTNQGTAYFWRTGSTWTEISSANSNTNLLKTTDDIPSDGRWYPMASGSLPSGMTYALGRNDSTDGLVVVSLEFSGDLSNYGLDYARYATQIFTPSFRVGDAAVTAAKLATDAVETAKIKGLAVTGSKIAAGTISADKMAAGVIPTELPPTNLSVTTAKIAGSAVTEGKINNGAVSADKLASNAVTTAKIADRNVTTLKIAQGAVNWGEIANDAVRLQHIDAGNQAANRLLAINSSNNGLTFTDPPSTTPGTNSITNAMLQDDIIGLAELNAGNQAANRLLAINSSNNGLTFVNAPSSTPGSNSVGPSQLNASSQAANRHLAMNSSNSSLVWVDPPSGGPTTTNIYTAADGTGHTSLSNASYITGTNLEIGDMVVVRLTPSTTISSAATRYSSSLFRYSGANTRIEIPHFDGVATGASLLIRLNLSGSSFSYSRNGTGLLASIDRIRF